MNILNQKKAVSEAVAIALGSNSSDSQSIFEKAVQLLTAGGLTVEKISGSIITAPVDCPPGTPDFINGALTGWFSGTACELLELTQAVEQQLGRPADHGFHMPRTLDLDIIIFGSQIIRTPRLVIPHPAAQERYFVLAPLSEIAPEWIFPDSGLCVKDALLNLKNNKPY